MYLRHKGDSHDKRSGSINTIHELSIREIARIVGIARNTVRRYLRGKAIAAPRIKQEIKVRESVLDVVLENTDSNACICHLYDSFVLYQSFT